MALAAAPSKKDSDPPKSELERLRDQLEDLRRQKEEIEKERDRLQHENKELREKLEAKEREMYRQAAPFRISEAKRATAPKRPGRKPGHPGASRAAPDHVDEEVSMPLDACPRCGDAVSDCREVEQFIEDLPAPRVKVTRILTYVGQCDRCGEVATSHPAQVSKATGAARFQVGPRAMGVAVDLNKRLGVPLRKTCDVLTEHFGIRLTAGALVQAEHRLAARLEAGYRQLMKRLQSSAVVYADETSWWVGGPGWWLWVFTSPHHTFYVVDERRNSGVVAEVLGDKFEGVLSSDCLNIYDGIPGIQNKCYAHHLKAIRKALEAATGNTDILQQLRSLLTTAIALGKNRTHLPKEDFNSFVAALENRADELLAKAVADPEAQKVGHRLLKQRDHLFTFLKHEGVDATNNAAERALRPAVVARKISCGNRTDSGRQTWQVLASLAATCRQQGVPFSKLVRETIPLVRSRAVLRALTHPPSG